MTRLPALTASAPVELTLSAVLGAVDPGSRTIAGLLIPPGDAIGSTSAGATRFNGAGAVSWHDDLRRVKLLREHNREASLGYATALEWTAAGLLGTFYLPPSPEGDRALVDASSGIRDGLSVGVFGVVGDFDSAGVLVVTASTLRETSLVSVPAFDDSRVRAVVASTAPTERHSMFTPAQLAALAAAGIDSTDTVKARAFLDSLSAAAPAAPAAPAALTAGAVADELLDRLTAGGLTMLTGPNGDPAAPAGAPNELNLSAFVDLVRAHYSGTGSADELRAALSDIIPANSPGAFRPAYLTELWDGAPYARKFIDAAMTTRPLPRALKIIGQRWQVAPAVDDYAGDKTAVPSNAPVLVDVPVDVKRLAGAHDVDRAYIDLGSPEWLTSYFEAQTESYRRVSDARAAAIVELGATALVDNGPDATPLTFTTLLEGIVAAVIAASNVGESVDYVAMSPGLVSELLNVTTLDAPAWFSGSFQLGGGGGGVLGGVTFVTSPGVSAGKFVTGNKSATRWHEFEPPVRVQALNVANGGIDLGVFGYYAGYVRNPAGVYVGTVGV